MLSAVMLIASVVPTTMTTTTAFAQTIPCEGLSCAPVITDGDHIAEEIEDTVEEIVVVVVDGNLIAEEVEDTVEEVMPPVTDGDHIAAQLDEDQNPAGGIKWNK